MKIAILIRGPVRPDHQTCRANVEILKNCFDEHESHIYLWTWNSTEAKKLSQSYHCFHKVTLVEELSETDIRRKLNEEKATIKNWSCNIYKQFWSMENALKSIDDSYDFIVQSRADTRIQINKDVLPQWFNPEHYTTIHAKGQNGGFTNDQFGIATPAIIKRVWKYHDYGELSTRALRPEDIIDFIAEREQIPLKIAPIAIWELNPRRHR
jgi:hypothetical protein